MGDCNEFITNIMFQYYMNGISALQNVPYECFAYSGKTLEDLGFYKECQQSGFNYAVLNLKLLQLPFQFNYGLCLPPQCTAANLENFGNFIIQVFNDAIGQDVVTRVLAIDPETVNPPFDILSGFVLFGIILIILVSIVGSIYSIKNKYKPTTQNKTYKILKCFSFYDNWMKLFTIKSDGQYKVFNGIRTISICWIVYGHTTLILGYQTTQFGNLMNTLSRIGWLTLAPSAYYAVDVFFFIGGFLTYEVTIQKLQSMKKVSLLLIPKLYFHRFIRLWPTYMVCLFFFWKLSNYVGGGPMWYLYVESTDQCNTQYWQNMLFIDNLFDHVLDYCYGWGWYLANDMQIFLIAPPLLLLFNYNHKFGLIVTWSLLTLSLLASYLICYYNNYHLNYPSPHSSQQSDYMSKYYYKPWIRACPYFIGILFGCYYKNIKLEQLFKQKQWFRVLMMIIGIGLIQFIMWIIIPVQKDGEAWTQQEQYLYQTFGRVIFIIGLMILILPSMYGINDPLSKLLSADLFVPLARVSFCVYLVHFFIILIFVEQFQQMPLMEPLQNALYTITFVCISFMVATIVSLCVEVPIMNLLKPPPKEIKKEKDNDEQELVEKQ